MSGFRIRVVCCFLFLAGMLPKPTAEAQPVAGRVTGGWRMPLMEENRLKTLLTGEGAEPVESGFLRISKVKIEIYDDQTPPQPRLVIDAPECFFDISEQQTSSSGQISLKGADGRYSIQGRGFAWIQAASQLSISNDVRTVISRSMIHPQTDRKSNAEPIHVRAGRFDYNRNSNVGTYRDNVEVRQGKRFQLTCQQLTVLLPEGDQEARTITAQGNLQIQFITADGTTTLTGETAHYQTPGSGETLTLRGTPSWHSGDYEGSGGEIDLENLNTDPIFTVRNRAKMSMPSTIAPQATPEGKHPKIYLEADSYTVSEAQALFIGSVNAHSEDGWEVESQRLTALINQKKQMIERIIAEQNVRIVQTDGDKVTQAIGSEIAFVPLGKNQADLVIEGQAHVISEDFNARGDRIHFRRQADETTVSATGNVTVDLQRFASSSGGFLGLGKAPDQHVTGESSDIRIRADTYLLKSGKGRFARNVTVRDAGGTLTSDVLDIVFGKTPRTIRSIKSSGNVQVSHEDGQLTCQQLAGDLSGSFNTLDRLIATGAVEIRNSEGTASGARAVYLVKEGLIELSGEPELFTRIATPRGVKNILTTADLLIWDQAKNTFKGRGKYRSQTLP
ncbi:MAG: Lipopolysaccharide export system protein LptA [Verrucomicrobia subdivision 3 bacterium]|nr:Lipopolysaccharide export system protein LptA [Limisphaerales bacterium]MCS1414666.1 Lipopolysaccharide export system protein LptA [Limisphaerales bacterium]